MKDNYKYFIRTFSSELVKMKNTIGLWSAVIFPVFVIFMNFMIFFNRPEAIEKIKTNPWIHCSVNAVTLWSFLFLPLYISVITFYVNHNEHKSAGWKHLYALPVPKQSIYISKFVVSILLTVASMFFLYVLNYLSIRLLASVRPSIPFGKFTFDSLITITFIKITFAGFGIISIQFVISLLFPNFIYPLGFGILATFTSVFLLSWKKIIYYPYAYSFFAAQDLKKGNAVFFTNPVVWGLITCAFVITAGYYVYSKIRIR